MNTILSLIRALSLLRDVIVGLGNLLSLIKTKIEEEKQKKIDDKNTTEYEAKVGTPEATKDEKDKAFEDLVNGVSSPPGNSDPSGMREPKVP